MNEYLGYVQFYLTEKSLVLYFNQGEIAPFSLGVISVEIPYVPEFFHIDVRHNYENEYLFEREYDKGYEWKVFDYSEDKLTITEIATDYPPEEIYSEYYPVGLKQVTAKGIKKGNASLILAHVEKGKGLETATQIIKAVFYVDENNKLSLITEEEAMFLIKK